jgi:hypothetical protein
MKASKRVQWGSVPLPVDRLSFPDRLFLTLSLAGLLLWAFPHVTFAQTVQEMPMIFQIDQTVPDQAILTPHEDYLAKILAADVPSKPADPRVELLRGYLETKHSPLADHAETLLQQYHYRLILGISFAESNFCRNQIMPNNCWGIGGGNPEQYATLDDGIVRANDLIQKYQNLGMTNPQLMRNTWVGWQNHSWVVAVNQVTQDLEQNGL